MAKAIKQHIINKGQSLVCGLKNANHIKTAFIDPEDNQLYDADCNLIDHTNYQCICKNCIKLFHPTYLNDLLKQKAMAEYRDSLPKSNRERRLRMKRMNHKRIDSNNKKHSNVIHLGYEPIMDGNRLIEHKPLPTKKKCIVVKPIPKSKPKKERIEAIIMVVIDTLKLKSNAQFEDSFIDFGDGVAMTRGFGNQWKVIYKNDDSTIDDLTDWIPYGAAYNEASQLVA